jgi:hypothetical protein
MTAWSQPFYQTLMQKLPKRMEIAEALGNLTGCRIKAVVNQAKVRLDLREAIQRTMFMSAYEPDQTAWFRQCLVPGDTVIDIGASFGYYTTLGSMLVGETGKVFAFEPSPLANKVIEDAIMESAISNIVLTKAAVGSPVPAKHPGAAFPEYSGKRFDIHFGIGSGCCAGPFRAAAGHPAYQAGENGC